MGEQRVHQSVLQIACSRMNDHSCRLVDHKKIVIFEQNLERDFFWNGFDFLEGRFGQLNHIVSANELARPRSLPIQPHETASNQIL